MRCLVVDCDREAIAPSDRCEKHVVRNLPPTKYLGRAKSIRVSKDRKRVIYPGPSNSPNNVVHVIGNVRFNLVYRLAHAVGDDHANAIVDALDAYLEAEPGNRLPAFQWLPPNPRAELDKARQERDEAVARAEKAEQELNTASKVSKPPKRKITKG